MTNPEIVTTSIEAFPNQGNPLINNRDPRLASVPLQQEKIDLDDLQEYHVYEFSVFIANAAGQSEMSMAIIQELPGAGRFIAQIAITSVSVCPQVATTFFVEQLAGQTCFSE